MSRDKSRTPLDKDVTSAQRAVLEALYVAWLENGRAPTVREMMQRVGVRSTYTIMLHYQSLERRGMVQRGPRSRHRAVWVTEKGEALLRPSEVAVFAAERTVEEFGF